MLLVQWPSQAGTQSVKGGLAAAISLLLAVMCPLSSLKIPS